jgi:hypothetical protein
MGWGDGDRCPLTCDDLVVEAEIVGSIGHLSGYAGWGDARLTTSGTATC